MVPEQADEGQAAEDDLALRGPGAGSLRPPGSRRQWLVPRAAWPLSPSHWRIPGGGCGRLPASSVPSRPPSGHAAPGLSPQSSSEAGPQPPPPLPPPAQPAVHAAHPLPAPDLPPSETWRDTFRQDASVTRISRIRGYQGMEHCIVVTINFIMDIHQSNFGTFRHLSMTDLSHEEPPCSSHIWT